MNIQEQEERDFVVATDQDWDNAEARELGAARPEAAWICTDRDVWHANPYYQGPPVPHPEDDYAHGIEWPEEIKSKEFPGDTHPDQDTWGDDTPDEDIPF